MGALTKSTGVSDQAVRHYERLGLIQSLGRTSGGFRLFDPSTVARIRFIRAARTLGYSLESIGILLRPKHQDDPQCKAARQAIADQLAQLDRQITRLTLHRAMLQRLADSCHTCKGPCHLECELNLLTQEIPLV